MANELNLWKRLQGETPKFFKRVRILAISLAGVAGTLLTAPSLIEGFILPDDIKTLCQYALVAGLVAAGNSSLTVKDSKPKNEN